MNCCPKCGFDQAAQDSCARCSFSPRLICGFAAYAPELADSAPGFSPEYFATLATLESKNFWFQARNALILWAFKKYFNNPHRYLEIGCGTGFVLSAIADAFPGMQIFGSEVFVEGLSFAKQRVEKAHLFQMDAKQIPYQRMFDVIGAFDVIEHIDDDSRVLQQMHRALLPGGGIIITVPQHSWLWSSQDEAAHHERRYSSLDLQKKVCDAGFRIAWTSSFVSLLLPAMAVSRMRKVAAGSDAVDLFSEFKISRALNFVLLKAMQLEMLLIRAGLRFPIGGSRILVAYKDA